MTISPARRAALEILRRVEHEGAYASVLLAALDRRMREPDRALCHELVLGVLRKQLWLDRALEHFADREIARVDLLVRLALRLGLYQLRFLSRVPPSAAVNESVNLVRAAGLKSAGSFANAVLRRATREPDYDPVARVTDPVEKLAIETSHPTWMIERWVNAFGFEEAAGLARAHDQSPSIAFRLTVKAIQSSAPVLQLIEEIGSSETDLSPSKIAPDGWRVAGRMPALLRKLSEDGLIYFQDEASQLVAHLVAAQRGDRILDVCAAPGSKTTHIAALAPGTIITAGDLHEHRLRTMAELAQRQGARSVQLVAYDATCALPFADKSFDRVLVDAPCSGTGTLRHSPEIRWRLQSSDIPELSIKQGRILANASAAVRAGGFLVYSTCSVEPEENEIVIKNFLDENSDFARVPLAHPRLRSEAGAIRTWPHRHDVDGFFVVLLERKN